MLSGRDLVSEMSLQSALVLMADSAACFGHLSDVVSARPSCPLLVEVVSERALVSGVNGLVGGELEGKLLESTVALDSKIVLFAVEIGDGVGVTCFLKISGYL